MIIVKLSGKALHDHNALQELCKSLANEQAILVHGGGVEVDEVLKALNFTTQKLDGIRVSPKEQMPYISAVLAGQCNKLLQGEALAAGLKAFGLLCTDFNVCKLTAYPKEYGQVASCQAYDVSMLELLVKQGYTPVMCSIGHNDKGEICNINADEVAAALAIAFKAPLVFFSDVKGVLNAQGEVIEFIDNKIAQELIDAQVITEGMAVKVKQALAVANTSQAPVFIASIFDELALAQLKQKSLRRIGTTLSA